MTDHIRLDEVRDYIPKPCKYNSVPAHTRETETINRINVERYQDAYRPLDHLNPLSEYRFESARANALRSRHHNETTPGTSDPDRSPSPSWRATTGSGNPALIEIMNKHGSRSTVLPAEIPPAQWPQKTCTSNVLSDHRKHISPSRSRRTIPAITVLPVAIVDNCPHPPPKESQHPPTSRTGNK